jgi:hypothetical protein
MRSLPSLIARAIQVFITPYTSKYKPRAVPPSTVVLAKPIGDILLEISSIDVF